MPIRGCYHTLNDSISHLFQSLKHYVYVYLIRTFSVNYDCTVARLGYSTTKLLEEEIRTTKLATVTQKMHPISENSILYVSHLCLEMFDFQLKSSLLNMDRSQLNRS